MFRLKCSTFSKELDQVDRHRFQVFTHLLVGGEEQVRVVPFFPSVQDVRDEGIVEAQVIPEDFCVVGEAAFEAFQAHVMVEGDGGVFDVSADVDHLKLTIHLNNT